MLCTGALAQYRGVPYSELYDTETVKSMKEDIGYLASAALEGRGAGSEGEKSAAEYVRARFIDAGLDIITDVDNAKFGIRQENGDTLVSRNVAGVITGYDRELKDKYIVIGARLDNLGVRSYTVDGKEMSRTYYGACGNASGLSILLNLARMLNTNRVLLRRSVILVAFGASAVDNSGSWYFLNRQFPHTPDIDAMINLDMLGTGSRGFYAYTASNADMNNIIDALASTLQPVLPEIVSREPVRSDHRSFYAKEIPSVFFTTGMYPEYNTENDTPSVPEYDNMERLLEYLYNFTLRLVNGKTPAFRPTDQVKNNAGASGTVPFYECDVKPSFLGSQDPSVFLKKWVYTYLKYPRAAVERGIQGRVLVDFVIDERGKVRDVKVLRGVDQLLDDEAVKVVSASPDWKPGYLRGKKVKTELSLYVEFKLTKRK